MAEFIDLGQYCKVCKALDFLPIPCNYCKSHFCKLHSLPTSHSCEPFAKLDKYVDDDQLSVAKKISCDQCKKKCASLEIVHCKECDSNYCFEHRLQEDHKCSKLLKEKEELLSKANKKITIVQKEAPKVKGAKNTALQYKVAFMKLKQKAKGLNSLPANERMYFYIQNDINNTVHEYFLCVKWSIGRIVDYLSTELKVTNNNHKLDCDKLVLRLEDENPTKPLPLDKTIEEFKGSLFNGQKLVLYYQNTS